MFARTLTRVFNCVAEGIRGTYARVEWEGSPRVTKPIFGPVFHEEKSLYS